MGVIQSPRTISWPQPAHRPANLARTGCGGLPGPSSSPQGIQGISASEQLLESVQGQAQRLATYQ
jgi:hypothetical protein